MNLFSTTPVRSYIISTPLNTERIQRVLRDALDKPAAPFNFFVAGKQESYIGYGTSFQYEESTYSPKSGTDTLTATGIIGDDNGGSCIHIDYSCDVRSAAFMIPVTYLFSGIIALAGLIVLASGNFIDGLVALAVAAIPYTFTRLYFFYYRSLLDGLHNRIMRSLRQG